MVRAVAKKQEAKKERKNTVMSPPLGRYGAGLPSPPARGLSGLFGFLKVACRPDKNRNHREARLLPSDADDRPPGTNIRADHTTHTLSLVWRNLSRSVYMVILRKIACMGTAFVHLPVPYRYGNALRINRSFAVCTAW